MKAIDELLFDDQSILLKQVETLNMKKQRISADIAAQFTQLQREMIRSQIDTWTKYVGQLPKS